MCSAAVAPLRECCVRHPNVWVPFIEAFLACGMGLAVSLYGHWIIRVARPEPRACIEPLVRSHQWYW